MTDMLVLSHGLGNVDFVKQLKVDLERFKLRALTSRCGWTMIGFKEGINGSRKSKTR
jgi:hypothetical protein